MPGLALIHPAFPAQTKTEAIKSQNRSENHENCTERKYLWPASSPEKGLYSTTVQATQSTTKKAGYLLASGLSVQRD
jgi:hypothetical protein